ncbi:MAG: hypothetical protein II932_08990 [Treponema sp.]|nr:hypothetical protein [Treponema sp.]
MRERSLSSAFPFTDRNASNSGSTLASAFLLQTLPDFTISVSLDAAGYNADNSDLTGTDPLYALVNMGKDFTLTATPGSGSFPADTEFEWTVRGTTLTGPTQKGRVITISPTAMGLTDTQGLTNSVSAAKNSPTGISISCTAKHADAVADVDGTDRTVNVYRLTIPAYKITVTPPAAPNALETEGSGADTVYLVTNGDLTSTSRKFRLKVEPVSTTDTFPDGTEFSWKFGSAAATTPAEDDDQRDELIGTMCGLTGPGAAVPSVATEYTISCTASLTGAVTPASAPATAKVKLKKSPKIGSKAAPDAVGDIVFSDGSFAAYDETLDDDQKSAAVAVIFDVANKKGIALQQSSKIAFGPTTCSDSHWGSLINDNDGSGNWEIVQSVLGGSGYGAFSYACSYSTAGYPSGWYLPAKNELTAIAGNKDVIKAALNSIEATALPSGDGLWSSSMDVNSDGDDLPGILYIEHSGFGTRYGNTRPSYTYYARAVRKFDD